MIRLLGKIPNQIVVAFSGGVDSVAAASFLNCGKRRVTLAFFNHGTKTSDEAENFCRAFSDKHCLPLVVGTVHRGRMSNESHEEYWRNIRYDFLSSFDKPVVTAHHLDDAVETWIFTSLHGIPRLIPYSRGIVIRPFLTTTKESLTLWCEKNGLSWIEDKTNGDVKFARNRIRHNIVPEALVINPGLRKMISKKYREINFPLDSLC